MTRTEAILFSEHLESAAKQLGDPDLDAVNTRNALAAVQALRGMLDEVAGMIPAAMAAAIVDQVEYLDAMVDGAARAIEPLRRAVEGELT